MITDSSLCFGHYRTVQVIGRGTVGTVYEAAHESSGRKVALKVMYRDLAQEAELRARFLREAEAVRGLDHPNIVRVVETGAVEDQPFIALEYVEGTDLEQIIQRRAPLSVEWKLDLLRQICDGLQHAHEQGIIHRDVKPANVRVTADGTVKVVDFGMARVNTSDLTKRGQMLGSVHYVAPEQIEGARVDHRADVFSVGAIAYELLAYRKPFDGDSVGAVLTRIMGEARDLRPLPRTAYSPGLERAVLKALDRDADRRQQSLRELRGELAEAVETAAHRGGVAR
jgi:eukaryotic-like serine/threonine-protein kinase